jgi:hypothetical protein
MESPPRPATPGAKSGRWDSKLQTEDLLPHILQGLPDEFRRKV